MVFWPEKNFFCSSSSNLSTQMYLKCKYSRKGEEKQKSHPKKGDGVLQLVKDEVSLLSEVFRE